MNKFSTYSKWYLYPLLAIVALSCDNQASKLIEIPESVILTEKESFEIVSSNEYKEYFSLRYQFLKLVKNAIDSGYNAKILTEISIESIQTNDHKVFYTAIFKEDSKGIHYLDKLTEAQLNLYKKFPVLYSINTDNDPTLSKSQISSFYHSIENSKINSTGNFSSNQENEVLCGSYWQQVKLLGCAGLCGTATAGAGAVLCGWACWCMLCYENSAVFDSIC